jgi:hypothetical protein
MTKRLQKSTNLPLNTKVTPTVMPLASAEPVMQNPSSINPLSLPSWNVNHCSKTICKISRMVRWQAVVAWDLVGRSSLVFAVCASPRCVSHASTSAANAGYICVRTVKTSVRDVSLFSVDHAHAHVKRQTGFELINYRKYV